MASKPWPDYRRMKWVMKYKSEPGPDGKWIRVVLGEFTGTPGKAAKPKPPHDVVQKAREFEEIEFRAKHGLKAAAPEAKLLRDYLDSYCSSMSLDNKASSIVQLRRHCKTFMEFAEKHGVRTIQGVGRGTCRDYVQARSKIVGANTLKTERGFLMGAWSQAVEDGLIAANPWSGTKTGKIMATSITFWSADEIARIVEACQKPWHKDFVLFMANTGLRISSALAVKWSWIDRSGRALTLEPDKDVKTTYTHMLNEAAREILDRRRHLSEKSPFVFPGKKPGEPSFSTGARGFIMRAIKRAKVTPGTPHDFRHSYGRALGLARVPVTVIQKQLGHSTLAMTMKYVAIEEEHVGQFTDHLSLGVRPVGGDPPKT